MNTDALRVAVVGAGHLGRYHLRKYARIDGVVVTGVVDPSGEARARAREIAPCHVTPDLSDVIGKIDAASVATPTDQHFETAQRLLAAGIHVLVEKPITSTSAQARMLINLAREKNVVLQVGHVERFNPGYQAVKGALSEPRFIEVHRLAPYSFRSMDIGVVQDLMIHDLDIILDVVDASIREVHAAGAAVVSPVQEDICNARLLFENGCVANVTASRISVHTMRKMRFFCRDAYLSLDMDAKKALVYRKSSELEMDRLRMRDVDFTRGMDVAGFDFFKYLDMREFDIDASDALEAEVRSFLGACRGDHAPEVPGEHGLRALSAAELVVERMHAHATRFFGPAHAFEDARNPGEEAMPG